jgi:hypothetical protein
MSYAFGKQYYVCVTCMLWCSNSESVPLLVSNINDIILIHTQYVLVRTGLYSYSFRVLFCTWYAPVRTVSESVHTKYPDPVMRLTIPDETTQFHRDHQRTKPTRSWSTMDLTNAPWLAEIASYLRNSPAYASISVVDGMFSSVSNRFWFKFCSAHSKILRFHPPGRHHDALLVCLQVASESACQWAHWAPATAPMNEQQLPVGWSSCC